jgi:hypothetical protein
MRCHEQNHEPGFASRHGRSALRIIGLTLGGIVFAVLFAFLFGLVVKVLWNWLMPALFGLGVITFWQAFGIVLLAKILFGGHGHGRRYAEARHDRIFRNTFKRFAGAGEADREDGPVPGNGERWRHFREFWQDEGKASFEAYLNKMAGREAAKPGPE